MNPGGRNDATIGGDFNLGLGPHSGGGWFVPAGPVGEHVSPARHQGRPELSDTACRLRENLRHLWHMLAQRSPRPLLHALDLPVLSPVLAVAFEKRLGPRSATVTSHA
jgi:hypothetical protein